MMIRKYYPSDLPEIIELFYETVQSINSKGYSSEQITAWISGIDIKSGKKRFWSTILLLPVKAILS